MIMTLHTHVYLVNFVRDSLYSWEVERMFYNGGGGGGRGRGGGGRGEGGGGLWEGEHLDTVNSILQAALADKPHTKFGNLNFGKKNSKEIN